VETFLSAMVGTVVGAVLSGVITFLVSRHYYMRAAKELSILALGLEEIPSVEYARGRSGNLSAARRTRTATAKARIGPSVDDAATPHEQ
jgi:hypothetical protein